MNNWDEMTLDEAWDWCIKMWSSISRQCLKDDCTHVAGMKEEWLNNNGIGTDTLDQDCFFCHYDKTMQTKLEAKELGMTVEEFLEEHDETGDCQFCPAKLIDRTFHCTKPPIHFEDNPRNFYKRVRELYKRYLNNE
jgi:hypothetical protein